MALPFSLAPNCKVCYNANVLKEHESLNLGAAARHSDASCSHGLFYD